MSTSLETVAKSRVYYPTASRPLSQPAIRVASRNVDPSDDKTVRENHPSSSDVSAASSSESSSNCRYETSSEGPPQRIEPLDRPPISVTPAGSSDDRQLVAFFGEPAKLLSTDPRLLDVHDVRGYAGVIDRSESLPVLPYSRQWDPEDPPRSSRQDDPRARLVSESSHARIKKIKRIVAYVESRGLSLSDAILISENKSATATTMATMTTTTTAIATMNPAVKTTLATLTPAPAVRDAFMLFNKPKGVTFLTLNEADVEGQGSSFTARSRNFAKPIPSRSEIVDDLIDIAKNPNPSIKSIYFPPSPEDSRSIAGDLESLAREPRSDRQQFSARNRSEIDALTRIEHELGPLQSKFSELAGKVRALNIIGTTSRASRVASFHGSPGRSTISRDPSGYFLHRAEAFYRHDSVGGYPSSFAIPALSTADLPTVIETRSAAGSRTWRADDDEFPRSFRRRPRDSESLDWNVSRGSRENFGQRENEVRFYHEKPVAYGVRVDFPSGLDCLPEKPERFVPAATSQRENFNRQGWDRVRSILPTEVTCHFHGHCQHKLANNLQAVEQICETISPATGGVIDDRRSSNATDVHLIDRKIVAPFARNRPSDEPADRTSSQVSRKHSISHEKMSDGSAATIHRVSSIASRVSAARSVKNRQCSVEKMHSRHGTRHEVAVRASHGRHGKKEEPTNSRHRHKHCRSARREEKNRSLNASIDEFADSQDHRVDRHDRVDGSTNGRHRHKHCRSAGREEKNRSPNEFTDSRDLRNHHSEDRIPSPMSVFVNSPDNSESLDVETKASFVSYSQVLSPSKTRLEIYSPAVEQRQLQKHQPRQKQKQMKFTGLYTERTVVRTDSALDPAASRSPRPKLASPSELSANSVRPNESLAGPLGFGTESRSSGRAVGREPRRRDSDEEVMIEAAAATTTTTTSDRQRIKSAKRDKRRNDTRANIREIGKRETSRGGKSRSASIDAFPGDFSTGSFASHVTQVAEKSTILRQGDSWIGEWRTGSRLSIAYNVGSCTSIRTTASSTCSTLNTARTVRRGATATASRLTIYRGSTDPTSPRCSLSNAGPTTKFAGSHQRLRGSRNDSPMSSMTRGSAAGCVIGVRTSPDDFPDDDNDSSHEYR